MIVRTHRFGVATPLVTKSGVLTYSIYAFSIIRPLKENQNMEITVYGGSAEGISLHKYVVSLRCNEKL